MNENIDKQWNLSNINNKSNGIDVKNCRFSNYTCDKSNQPIINDELSQINNININDISMNDSNKCVKKLLNSSDISDQDGPITLSPHSNRSSSINSNTTSKCTPPNINIKTRESNSGTNGSNNNSDDDNSFSNGNTIFNTNGNHNGNTRAIGNKFRTPKSNSFDLLFNDDDDDFNNYGNTRQHRFNDKNNKQNKLNNNKNNNNTIGISDPKLCNQLSLIKPKYKAILQFDNNPLICTKIDSNYNNCSTYVEPKHFSMQHAIDLKNKWLEQERV